MTAQISDATAKFLGQVMPVIVGTRRRNGAVNLNPAWYELRDGYLRLNSWRGAHSLDHLERDRQATLLFIDPQDMFGSCTQWRGWYRPPPTQPVSTSIGSSAVTAASPYQSPVPQERVVIQLQLLRIRSSLDWRPQASQ
jgi:hypothetical protein